MKPWQLALLALLLPGGVLALVPWVWRRMRRTAARTDVATRTDRQEALLAALTEWLQVGSIQEAMVREGVAQPEGMKLIFKRLGKMGDAELRATAAALLRSRRVRQVIAEHVARAHGAPKADVMRGLLELANVTRPEVANPTPKEMA